ncbi:L-seryl-tRNA(Sec) selenium transferase [Saccharopolyspora halophila]|uniref:L-seryl-tRNA(Sec) selenium transferase n=1 Tax=Saccharopolyspora halophila TaxID=405551 RepID=A0ABN3GHH7_9PSEU
MRDPRRDVPGTDRVLADPAIAAAIENLGHRLVKRTAQQVQQRARDGELDPSRVVAETLAALPDSPSSVRAVVNATGVLLHTNLGRAPLSDPARDALLRAAGTTDVELDLHTGKRGTRGAATIAALREAVPAAEAAHVVNNGAAALALAATALAAGGEIVLARGELVEIGDGFRIPDLLTSTGARLREVGTTNRVRLDDYRAALGEQTGFVLKVHPSNFVISGFTAAVPAASLRELDAPVVVDIGSGLLEPDSALPDEPDAHTALADGADLVIASGDKLLGGPQCGLLLGRAQLIERLRKHPLARALRVDKLTLAALEATVRGPRPPTARALHADPARLLRRARALAEQLTAAGLPATAVESEATAGGGGAPGALLPSAAVALPERFAKHLRLGDPPVLARLERDRCLLDLAAVPEECDETLRRAALAAG